MLIIIFLFCNIQSEALNFVGNIERQTDKTKKLAKAGELERNKFRFLPRCFISKAKQIIDEPNVMGTTQM